MKKFNSKLAENAYLSVLAITDSLLLSYGVYSVEFNKYVPTLSSMAMTLLQLDEQAEFKTMSDEKEQ